MKFRGTKVIVRSVQIEKGVLHTTFSFVDQLGRTHGEIRHELHMSRLPAAAKSAAEELLSALRSWGEDTHFEMPIDGPESRPKPQGVLDLLRNEEDEDFGFDLDEDQG